MCKQLLPNPFVAIPGRGSKTEADFLHLHNSNGKIWITLAWYCGGGGETKVQACYLKCSVKGECSPKLNRVPPYLLHKVQLQWLSKLVDIFKLVNWHAALCTAWTTLGKSSKTLERATNQGLQHPTQAVLFLISLRQKKLLGKKKIWSDNTVLLFSSPARPDNVGALADSIPWLPSQFLSLSLVCCS